jgi:hypothetical protein
MSSRQDDRMGFGQDDRMDLDDGFQKQPSRFRILSSCPIPSCHPVQSLISDARSRV